MRKRKPHSLKNLLSERQAQDKKEKHEKQLHKILYHRPMSRRMAATALGYPDMTYMVTQFIYDWIESGRAQVVGRIRCERSTHIVDAISTNPKYFRKNNDNHEILWK